MQHGQPPEIIHSDMTAVHPKLVPTLREGVDVIKMVLFRELKHVLDTKHPEKDAVYVKRLAGAAVSELFGVTVKKAAVDVFREKNHAAVQNATFLIPRKLDHLRIPLTDALRIQFLCDSHEGIDSTPVLENAKKCKILIDERDAPLPGAFMHLVRIFGRAYGILESSSTQPGRRPENETGGR